MGWQSRLRAEGIQLLHDVRVLICCLPWVCTLKRAASRSHASWWTRRAWWSRHSTYGCTLHSTRRNAPLTGRGCGSTCGSIRTCAAHAWYERVEHHPARHAVPTGCTRRICNFETTSTSGGTACVPWVGGRRCEDGWTWRRTFQRRSGMLV